jgi:hypothetical protein
MTRVILHAATSIAERRGYNLVNHFVPDLHEEGGRRVVFKRFRAVRGHA